MEFFINKNATLPLLKMQIVKDGRSDYNEFMSLIEKASISFSMIDVETGLPRITSKTGGFVSKTFIDPDTPPEYYIFYKFTKRDTSKVGRYEGQFMLKTDQGTLIVPIREKLYINVTDSFISDEICCDDQSYLQPCPPSTPCPVCPSQTPLPSPSVTPTLTTTSTPTPSVTPGDLNVNLIVEVMSGSVICNYKLILSRPLDQTVSLGTIVQLGLLSGGTYDTPGITIFVPAGSLSGETTLFLNDLEYGDLSTESTLIVTQLSPSGYSYEVFGQVIFQFPLPTPTPTNTETPTLTPSVTQELTPTPSETQSVTPTPTNTQTPTPSTTSLPIPLNDLTFILIPDSDLEFLYIPNGNFNYVILPSNDLDYEIIQPTPTPTPTLTPTNTETPTPTPTETETATPTPTETPTPTPCPITYETITDTVWIYPPADVQYALNNTTTYYNQSGNTLYFSSITDMGIVYDEIYGRTSVTQPIGNKGYSLGVGTILSDLGDELYFRIEGTEELIVKWRLSLQLTDQTSLPVGGDSPNYTTGYLTVYENWPPLERPEFYDPVLIITGSPLCVSPSPTPSNTETPTPTTTPTVTPTTCYHTIVVASLWNGVTNINTNLLQLTQTSETVKIQVGDTITDNLGSTSIVGLVSSDGTYTYVGTGPGGTIAFDCQFPLTFFGPEPC